MRVPRARRACTRYIHARFWSNVKNVAYALCIRIPHTRCGDFGIHTTMLYIMKSLSYWVGKLLLNLSVFVDTVSVAMSVIW